MGDFLDGRLLYVSLGSRNNFGSLLREGRHFDEVYCDEDGLSDKRESDISRGLLKKRGNPRDLCL